MWTSVWISAFCHIVLCGGEPLMFFSTTDEIYVRLLHSQLTLPIVQEAGPVQDIAFGPNNTVLWINSETSSVNSVTYDHQYRYEGKLSIVDTGLTSPSSISVDSRNRNVYIADSGRREIIVCSLKGDNCAVLLKVTNKPRDVVIDERSRLIYWTETAVTGSLEMSVFESRLDATMRRKVYHAAHRIYNLLVHVGTRTLYWLSEDHITWTVQAFDLRNDKVSVVLTTTIIESGSRPSMSILDDDLYLHTGNHTRVLPLVKGRSRYPIISDSVSEQNIRVVDDALNSTDGKLVSKCDPSPCSHICIDVDPELPVTCLCPLAAELTSQTQCQPQDIDFIIVSGYFGIFRLPTEFIGTGRSRGQMLVAAHAIVLTFEPGSKTIIFYDDKVETIQSFPLDKPSDLKTLYTAGYVEALAVDAGDELIYWTTFQGEVYTGTIDGANVTKLMDSLSKPRGITLDTSKRVMYISTWGRVPCILRCAMDGSQCEVVLEIPGGHPNMVALATEPSNDAELLYWTDSQLDLVAGTQIDDPAHDIEIVVKGSRKAMHPFALAVTRQHVYFTDINSNTIHVVDRVNITKEVVISPVLGSLYGLVVIETPNDAVPPQIYASGDSSHVAVVMGFLVVILVLLCLIVVLVLWHRRSRSKSPVTGLMRYMKTHKEEDCKRLMSKSLIGSQNFQNFDDLDYPVNGDPVYKTARDKTTSPARELSIISADSAFVDRDNSSTDSVPLLL